MPIGNSSEGVQRTSDGRLAQRRERAASCHGAGARGLRPGAVPLSDGGRSAPPHLSETAGTSVPERSGVQRRTAEGSRRPFRTKRVSAKSRSEA